MLGGILAMMLLVPVSWVMVAIALYNGEVILWYEWLAVAFVNICYGKYFFEFAIDLIKDKQPDKSNHSEVETNNKAKPSVSINDLSHDIKSAANQIDQDKFKKLGKDIIKEKLNKNSK